MTRFGEDAGRASDATDMPGALDPPTLHDAGFAELICLVAWLRARGVSGMRLAGQSHSKLAPTDDLDELVHETLKSGGFIEASRPARTRRRPRLVFTEFPGELEDWRLSPSLGEAETVLVDAEMRLATYSHTADSLAEAAHVWQVLAIAESMSFLIEELEDHYMDARWALFAEPALERAVEILPTSRVFNLCWLAVRDVASAYLKFPNSRHELGHTLRRALEQKLGKSQSERWDLRSFNRHTRSTESQLAATFSTIFNLDTQYLQAVPSPYNLVDVGP